MRSHGGACEQQDPPATRAVTPAIAAPVSPSSVARSPASAAPIQPPCLPSVSIRPSAETARPVRKGRSSMSALRVSIRPPTTMSTRAAQYTASPITVRGRIDDPAADRAAVPVEVDDRRQEEPEGGEPEPDELGVLVVARALLRRALLDAGAWGRLRGRAFAALRSPWRRRVRPGDAASWLGGERSEVFGARRAGSRAGRTGRPRVTNGRAPTRIRAPVEAFDRPDEHGQLEVGLGDAHRRRVHAGPLSTGAHSTSSAGPGSPYQERPSARSASSSSR